MNTANAPTQSPSPFFDAETLAGLNAAFRTSNGAEQVDTTAIRAVLRDSAHSHSGHSHSVESWGQHSHSLLDGGHSHNVQWCSPTGKHEHLISDPGHTYADANGVGRLDLTGAHTHPIFHPEGVYDPGHSHGGEKPWPFPAPGHTHVEHDEPGQFQPFNDLRPKAPAVYGVTLPGDGGPDAINVMDLPGNAKPFAERVADLATQYPAPKPDVCANCTPGVMLPDCMSDEQFEAALAAMSKHWNAAVDSFLAAWTAAQEQAAEGAIAAIAA